MYVVKISYKIHKDFFCFGSIRRLKTSRHLLVVSTKCHAISDIDLRDIHDRPTRRDLNGSNRGIDGSAASIVLLVDDLNGSNRGIDGSAASIVLLVDRCRLISRGPQSEELDEEPEDSEDTAAWSVRVSVSNSVSEDTYKAKKVNA
jgi:hypothetical protein